MIISCRYNASRIRCAAVLPKINVKMESIKMHKNKFPLLAALLAIALSQTGCIVGGAVAALGMPWVGAGLATVGFAGILSTGLDIDTYGRDSWDKDAFGLTHQQR